MTTAVLVSREDQKEHLRVKHANDDALIQSILDPVESLFLIQCGRTDRPFATTATGRAEVLNGTGTRQIMLDYPISSIVSIELGPDSSDPEETLTATDVDEIAFATGKRAVYRTDGGIWRERNETRVIHITYNHDADLPDFPKIAIKRAVAGIYRQIGSEDAKSETLPDGYTRQIAEVVSGDPIWNIAIESAWEPSIP